MQRGGNPATAGTGQQQQPDTLGPVVFPKAAAAAIAATRQTDTCDAPNVNRSSPSTPHLPVSNVASSSAAACPPTAQLHQRQNTKIINTNVITSATTLLRTTLAKYATVAFIKLGTGAFYLSLLPEYHTDLSVGGFAVQLQRSDATAMTPSSCSCCSLQVQRGCCSSRGSRDTTRRRKRTFVVAGIV